MGFLLGLQLYSVRQEFENDYKTTLKRVADLGFEGVEFAGFYDIPAEELKETLDELGLKVAGSHTSYDLLLHNLEEVMDYNRRINNKHIICPMCTFESVEILEDIINNFKRIGIKLREEGFVFSYHNHNHEFVKLTNQYIMDEIFTQCDDVIPELDVYWVYRGGENEKDYISKYIKDMKLVHLKDGTLECGTSLLEGNVDILGVIDLIKDSDIEWAIIEDETPYPESFASVERSITNILDKIKG